MRAGLPVRDLTRLAPMAALALLAACGDGPRRTAAPPPPSCATTTSIGAPPAVVPAASPYDEIFDAAAAEFGVPAALLSAVGYVETRWQMVEGHEEFPGMPAAYGVMALRGERLRAGARLAGVSEARVRHDAAANIRAAAALMRAHADSMDTGARERDGWTTVAARFSGIASAAGRDAYARDVDAVQAGRRAAPAGGAASVAAGVPCEAPPPPVVDHAGATWRASPNFNQRQADVHMVIIHSCEGSYAGCWSWLANPASQVSAHYVVREDGGEITQLVRESARAWHIAATYDSTRNAGHHGTLQGVQGNHFTIGIEHGGYASQASWPVEQIDASARLVCGIAKRWGIPRDKLHIVSHAQLQPWNRTDPGAGWPWDDYLARIDRYCAA